MSEKQEITFPHCDARILHAPGECEYCDNSGLQEVREAWNIAFTGHVTQGKRACPADQARSTESLNHWPGNRPSTRATDDFDTALGQAKDALKVLGTGKLR